MTYTSTANALVRFSYYIKQLSYHRNTVFKRLFRLLVN